MFRSVTSIWYGKCNSYVNKPFLGHADISYAKTFATLISKCKKRVVRVNEKVLHIFYVWEKKHVYIRYYTFCIRNIWKVGMRLSYSQQKKNRMALFPIQKIYVKFSRSRWCEHFYQLIFPRDFLIFSFFTYIPASIES